MEDEHVPPIRHAGQERGFSPVIARNARRLRLELGATQEEVAREVRNLGVPWTAGRVASLEWGEGAGLPGNLLLLVYGLDQFAAKARGRLSARPEQKESVRVADLLIAEGGVELSPGFEVPSAVVTDILAGGDPAELFTYHREWDDFPGAITALPEGTDPRVREAWASYGRTESRVAQSIGVNRYTLVHLAVELWGRGFSAERDARAEDTGITSRGRKIAITRGLVAELSRRLESRQSPDPVEHAGPPPVHPAPGVGAPEALRTEVMPMSGP